jgi:ribonucleoside-diphosphate reductase alpha chain
MKDLPIEVEKLLSQRYYQNGEDWDGLVDRVVRNICRGEDMDYTEACHYDIYNRVWLPNSPCIVSAGHRNGGLMACFVAGPVEDSLENHGLTLLHISEVAKRGGGCGFTGTNIREKGATVQGSAHSQGSRGIAYGPNAWALRVSDYCDMITQGGYRKMALMYTLSSDHPDIGEFIELKNNGNEKFAYNFNQSVFASDEWMEDASSDWNSDARLQLDTLAHNAWRNGEPGLLFADTINNTTPYSECGCPPIMATNPCGEQPLPPYGSCNLGSINISHELFIDNGVFDFGELYWATRRIARFLDNVGTINRFPNELFESWYRDHRPIGIGIMGYADALLEMGIAYGSDDSLDFLEEIGATIAIAADEESGELGQERGIPAHCREFNRRNVTLTTVAPTGSIAFLAGCSHGIEPVFSPSFTRTDERGEVYAFDHAMADKPHFRSSINSDPDKMPTWKEHVDVQAAAQNNIDSGVSKTINLPNSASIVDVKNAMKYAWQSGCKGITIYRDGSRDEQILNDNGPNVIDCVTGICDV